MTPSRKLALAYLSMYTGAVICGVSLLGLVGWIVVRLWAAEWGWVVLVAVLGLALMLGGAFAAMDLTAKGAEEE